MMASMRHPNVVMYLGLCMDPPCVVTEYCARGSLNDVLKRARQMPALASQLDWARRCERLCIRHGPCPCWLICMACLGLQAGPAAGAVECPASQPTSGCRSLLHTQASHLLSVPCICC